MAYFPDDQIELRPSLGQVCSKHGQEIQGKSHKFEENHRKSQKLQEKSGSEVDLGRRGWPVMPSSRKAFQEQTLGVVEKSQKKTEDNSRLDSKKAVFVQKWRIPGDAQVE